ncbi:hypothetical protein [Spirosoma sp. KUDC1026]|uniref:hypothetical protein n=1 Tax=Spirosoma sp. KUDC1026 TaxID=2745947 RepID=UPI001E2D59B0|nr:hypothetical protein [Spirosoma sp. KUDC1026]
MQFQNSSIVPGASGNVTVKQDKNKNYTIHLDVVNLAPPDKLDPPQNAYLVWMESDNNSLKKLGQITTSTGLFSKTFKADLTVVETVKPDRVFITAERSSDTQYPDGPVVLTTKR